MLKGKYAKLRDDLRKAILAGVTAEENNPSDGGTCNFDASGVLLSRWNREMVREAAREAGTHASEWGGMSGWWVVSPKTHSQGLARTRNAEAVTAEMAKNGYVVCGYYQMD